LSDGRDYEAIGQGKRTMTEDALIAATAKVNSDYLVTNDENLRKIVRKNFRALT